MVGVDSTSIPPMWTYDQRDGGPLPLCRTLATLGGDVGGGAVAGDADEVSGSPLRVLVVIDSLGSGGAEESMLGVLPGLRDAGIQPEVALLRSIAPDREAELAARGVPVRVLGGATGPLALARALRPVLVAEQPDLVHVTLFTPIMGGALAALGTGVPVLASIVSTPPATRRGGPADTGGARWKVRLVVFAEGWVCRHLVSRVHAVTPGVRDAVEARFRVPAERIVVAERGRDGERFHPPTPAEHRAARAALDVSDDDELLVAIGRHEPAKGFADLVDAFALLTVDHPRGRLLIAGREASATASIKARIGAHGLEGRVELLGHRSDPELLLAAADVFVLSSRREGTSGVTIEAMATGLPIVATELEGLRGIVIDGLQACTVPMADPPALARAVGEVLDDPELAAHLGAAGRRVFEERFTVSRSLSSLAALYRSAATVGRGRIRFRLPAGAR